MLTLKDLTEKPYKIYVNRIDGIRVLDSDGNELHNTLLNNGVLTIGESVSKMLADSVCAYIDSLRIYGVNAVSSYLAEFDMSSDEDEKIVVIPDNITTELIARDTEKRSYALQIFLYKYIGSHDDSIVDSNIMRLERLLEEFRRVVFQQDKTTYVVDSLEVEQLFDIEQYSQNFMYAGVIRIVLCPC